MPSQLRYVDPTRAPGLMGRSYDGDRLIVASNAGSSRHPSWYHNIRAHPHVTFGGTSMRATVVEEEAERQRLWKLADRVFATFTRYRRDAAEVHRTIPIVRLSPLAPDTGAQLP